MNSELRRLTDRARDRKLDQVARIASAQLGDIAPEQRLREFCEHYFKHAESSAVLTRPAAQIAAGLIHHSRRAMRRLPGQSQIDISIPVLADDGWDAGGHTVLTVVTDDKAWLVDTITVAVIGQGWSIRELIHPQFRVIRDESGRLLDMAHRWEGKQTTAEAWLWLELYPPLGASAIDARPELVEALEASLADLDAATADLGAMRAAMLEAADQAEASAHSDAETAAEMLRWLADDRFLLLGVRDFDLDVETGRFSPRPGGLGILRSDERALRAFGAAPHHSELLIITKDSARSRVRRASHLDYLGLHLRDADGAHIERRFLGLFTASALSESVLRVPILRDKATQIAETIGYDPDSYGGRAVMAAMEAHPREEMLRASAAELTPIIAEIAELDDPRQVISYVRRGEWGRFLTALIYFPRERYNTTVRQRIETLLLTITGAESSQWSVQVGESPLARLYVTLKMPDGQPLPSIDPERLRRAIEEASRDWDDRFLEIAERMDSAQRGVEWSDGYKEEYVPLEAVNDLVALNLVAGPDDMAQIMYVPSPPENGVDFRLKMLRVGSEMVLSQMLPHLSSLGVDVIDEKPFDLELRGQDAHIYDFGLRLPGGPERLDGWSHEARERFTSAVAASYAGLAEADGLNRLVTDTLLTWQQIGVLRAISRYLRQLGTTYSQPYIAATLHKHRALSAGLVALFEAKFDPWGDDSDRAQRVEDLIEDLGKGIDKVSALDEDRILRQYLAVIKAMTRTNFYALDSEPLRSGTPRPGRGALAFKLDPRPLDFIASPQPPFELFVYSPRVEGVHLRYGKVARGGLRWSDRAEDYRTEVMGLVKAQLEKNSIIVPVGAKGGFYPQRLAGLEPSARATEGRGAYADFIRALLSVTDNIVEGAPQRPDRVVAWDTDDPYLVVAADKGTATFSDLANQIAIESGFWLGDAFASGGSEGYDHKAMGITARGAWVSVERHFGELGIDTEHDCFTCVGIGDMSGDVFGNGMLRSANTLLVAAFNHQHIFLDPNPDAATSFAERERLFKRPRSSWADYKAELISAGGGVYQRSAKTIPVNDEVRRVLGLGEKVTALTPNEMIQAILCAPVDLMWNGGIGTWVKSSRETHTQVGDRGNDGVRVDADKVRARCVGEGGNLGWTQAARVEYALGGGLINTDSVDNSAGVHTSDYEVNIKILLDGEVAAGRLDRDGRNQLLHQMTDEVAGLVLEQNLQQNRTLANSLYDASANVGVHEELMSVMESRGQLNRGWDGLPATNQLMARAQQGQGLVGPELCVLLSTVKNVLAAELLQSDLPDDPYLADRLVKYFPTPLRERYAEQMPNHRLAREIITTVAVNRFVDSQGISAAHRMGSETGATLSDVVRAQLAGRNLTEAGWLETAVAASGLGARQQTRLRVQVRRLVDRATRWLLQDARGGFDIEATVADLKPGVREVMAALPEVLTPNGREAYQATVDELAELRVPEELATRMGSWRIAHLALPIVRVAQRAGRPVTTAAAVYFELGERLGIDLALDAASTLPRTGRWDIMARATVRDELSHAQSAVAEAALAHSPELAAADKIVQAWWEDHPDAVYQHRLLEEASQGETDLARMSVAVGSLRALLQR